MTSTPRFFARGLAVCALLSTPVYPQQQQSPLTPPLPVNAILVLTPEFCASEIKQTAQRFKEHFTVGQAACADLEPALKSAFPTLTVANTPPAPGAGNTQLILLPRFVDAAITLDVAPITIRRMDVLLEWSAKDNAGHTLWLETIHGLATHDPFAKRPADEEPLSARTLFRTLLATSVKDAAIQSAAKMAVAPELHKVAQPH